MIWAYILQRQEGAANIERGKFGFSTLPVHGDHIQTLSAKRGIDILSVQHLQHTPIGDADYEKPTVHIICSLNSRLWLDDKRSGRDGRKRKPPRLQVVPDDDKTK